jgi:hypothetical protein
MPRDRFRRTPAGALAALLLTLTHQGMAQGIQPGDRVRVVPRGGAAPWLVGTVIRKTADSIWLRPRGRDQPEAVALGAGLRLERSLGWRPHTASGALIGAGVGAGVTLLFLSAFCGGDTLCNGDEQVRAAVILGLPCVALGAGVGALIRVERWAPVPGGAGAVGGALQVGLRFGWSSWSRWEPAT